jgi:hypothetical protein
MLHLGYTRGAKFLSIVLLLSSSPPLRGADTHGVLCNSDPSSSLAFVGTLTDLTPAETNSPWWNWATFRVNEPLQGQPPAELRLLMRRDVCRDGGTTPNVGGRYLVQTHTSPKGSIYQLEDCKQVRPVDEARTTVEYLRSSLKGTAPSELFGEVVVDTGGYPGKRVPLPHTKIRLAEGSHGIDFVSDENGELHAVLNPGKYAITTEFPAGYDTYYVPPALTIMDHRCTQLTLGTYPTASITAHIVDVDGAPLGPMSNVQLTLETADDQQFVASVYPNEKSDLTVEHLLPGEYILGLNTWLPVIRGFEPYPPTYFPDANNRSRAQVITLKAGEHKVLSEMRVKKGKPCEIPVQVVDGLGKPLPSTQVALAYSDYPHFYVGPNEQTDEAGKETVYAVFPGPVYLRAEKRNENGSTDESEQVEVNSCPLEPVQLKLTRTVVE